MSDRNKATHRGTCQVCGRLQKLPQGVLSQHGYTKKWGFFQGTCPGAHYRPFEIAFDRVQDSIDRTNAQIQNLYSLVTTLKGPIDSNEAPFHKYDKWLGGYTESIVIVSRENGVIKLTEKNHPTDKPATFWWGNTYGCFGTVEEAIRKLRDQRITRIENDIKRRDEYVKWQERRVREWKPETLTPVGEAA